MLVSHIFQRKHTKRQFYEFVNIYKVQKTRDCCSTQPKTLTLDCYVDADFAGLYGVEDDQDPVCVKLRTGYCLTLDGCGTIIRSRDLGIPS